MSVKPADQGRQLRGLRALDVVASSDTIGRLSGTIAAHQVAPRPLICDDGVVVAATQVAGHASSERFGAIAERSGRRFRPIIGAGGHRSRSDRPNSGQLTRLGPPYGG